MSDWTSGYVADIGYTYGYYPELNPQKLRLAFINSGMVFPEVSCACELGFGQGLSVNIHSAASSVQWYGTDFNPSQAAFAQELSAGSDSCARLFDESFAEFCMRDDLPDFDFIAMHGIWSWISDENRKLIVDFVRRKLRVGGIFYISYNTQPGWASMVPMRHLMTLYADVMGVSGHGIINRIDASLDFASRLLDANPAYSRVNPSVAERLKKIKEQNRNYLAHEYFNRDWHPMHFAEMAEWLAPAKLSYACSSHYPDHVDALNFSVEQQAFLKEIKDSDFRESVRDFIINQQFRRDYWVKGIRRLTGIEQSEILRSQRFILVVPEDSVELKITGSAGEVTLNENVYRPIVNILADHKVKSFAMIEEAVREQNITFVQILQAVLLLAGKGYIASAQDDEAVSMAMKHTKALNLQLMNKARGSADIGYLASPVTGGGISVNRIQQLFLLARHHGRKTSEDLVQYAWQILSSQGQRIIKDGRVIDNVQDNLTELSEMAKKFSDKTLPVLRGLGIAD